ncbi:MAG: MATE family efflux transporter [Clostridia bacterium]
MQSTNDLTKGNVRSTLIKYAIPMILTSVMQSLYGMVDMIIVGQFVGGDAVSAINNGSLIMTFLSAIAIGFTVGGNIVIGQNFGAKNGEEAKKASGTLFALTMLAGIICSIVFYIFSRNLLVMLGAPSLEDATTYLKICSFGIPFIFSYNALNATLRAVGNSKKPFHFIASAMVLNIILDIIFVAVLDLAVFGVALATMISQFFSFILAFIYVYKNRETTGLTKKYFKLDKNYIKLITKYGFPLALQSTVGSISWLVVAYLLNKYGTDVSAGNGISNKIKEFCQLFITSISSATATMAAQNIGAKQFDRAKQAMKECMKITLSLALLFIIICEIFAPMLVSIFINDSVVANYAVANLRIEIIAQLFYAGFYSFNVLANGSGHTLFVMVNSFLNCIVVRLILAIILESTIGLTGIYLACLIAPSVSVPVGYMFYKSNKWKHSLK